MENNALTPSPAPVAEPGTSMPEFAAAPTALQEPVLPPASSMPSFGMEQPAAPVTQPVQPVQPAQPVEQPVAQPAEPQTNLEDALASIIDASNNEPVNPMPMPETTGTETPEQPEAPTSTLGEIVDDNTPAAPATPEASAAEAQPTQTIDQLVAEKAETQTPSTPVTPEKKKLNVKLFALIGAAVVLIGGGIVTFMLLNQPAKPANNPSSAPVVTNLGPDTSTPFEELTADKAIEFLEAAAEYKTYFPEDYAEEEDMIALDGSQTIALYYSYDKKDNILKTLKTSPVVTAYKDKLSSENVTIDQSEDYATITIDSTAVKCKDVCYGLMFNQKIVNYYNDIVVNPAAGINLDHIILTKHADKDIKKYAPLVAAVFMNGQKVYSTEVKKIDDIFTQYIVKSVEYQEDGKNVQTKQTFFTINSQTGEMLYHPEMEVVTQLEAVAEETELDEPTAE